MANIFYPVGLYSTKEADTVYGILKRRDEDQEITVAFCSEGIDKLAAELSASLRREYRELSRMTIGIEYQVPVMRIVTANHSERSVDVFEVLELEEEEIAQFELSLKRNLEKLMIPPRIRRDVD
ncbi:hypothetical protein HYU19_05895 [Candidatus Woesearchaeota archaeon]|nr:hypothetical protein [Candidatus Woesearchaeota archaeon]